MIVVASEGYVIGYKFRSVLSAIIFGKTRLNAACTAKIAITFSFVVYICFCV